MKITINETNYEFKTFFAETNRFEIHLFKNDKPLHITPLGHWVTELPSPSIMFTMYIQILKNFIEVNSVQVHFKK